MDIRRILNALAYALTMAALVLGTVGQPHDWKGWLLFLGAAILTGYGKYSSSTTLVAMDRAVWTDEQRAQKLGTGL